MLTLRSSVSVVVPAFNAAGTVAATIRSLKAQSHVHFDAVIVDDGSSDATRAAAEAAIAGDGRFRIATVANRGVTAARNHGLSLVRGEAVAFLDADDLYHPDFLGLASAALERDPDAPFAYALSRRFSDAYRIIPSPDWPYPPRHDVEGIVAVNTVANGSAAMFRRAPVERVGGFDEGLAARKAEGAADWKLAVSLAHAHPPCLIERQLVCYRITGAGMARRNPRGQIAGLHAVIGDLAAAFPDIPEQAFRDARTTFNGWLLGPILATEGVRGLLEVIRDSYLRNPRALFRREMRTLHRMKIQSILAAFRPQPFLWDIREGGRRPYAFLDPAARGGDVSPKAAIAVAET